MRENKYRWLFCLIQAFVLVVLIISPRERARAFLARNRDTLGQVLGFSHEYITKTTIQKLDLEFFSVTKISTSMDSAIKDIVEANANIDNDQQTAGKHFDGESFTDIFGTPGSPGGQSIVLTNLQKVEDALKNNDVHSARKDFGAALHTIQDFYSHTNWVEEGNSAPNPIVGRPGLGLSNVPVNLPTCVNCTVVPGSCPDCSDNLLPNGLTSGYFGGEDRAKPNSSKCSHGGPKDTSSTTGEGINKDTLLCGASPHNAWHIQAVNVALGATKQFTRDVKAAVTQAQMKLLLGAGPSLVIAIDTTGSMGDIISSVQQDAVQIVNSRLGTDQEPSQYVLAPFNDPTVGPVTVTTDPDTFKNAVLALTANGGGDCPELSVTGMQQGLAAADELGDLYMFTDASSKDGSLAPQVSKLAVQKEIDVNESVFGSCSPLDPAYIQIANDSGGQLFFLQRSEASTIGNLASFQAKSDEVHLLSIGDTLTGTAKTYTVPVDSTMTSVTFSASGTTSATVKRPDGSTVQAADPGVSFLGLSTGAVYSISSPKVGSWTITVNGSGAFTLSVTGESPLRLTSFTFTQVEGRPGHEGYFPVPGFPTGSTSDVDAVIDGSFNSAQFTFRSKSGTTLATFSLTQGTGDFADEFVGAVSVPTTPFLVYVTGTDTVGTAYERALPGTLQSSTVKVTPPLDKDLIPSVQTSYVFRVQNFGPADTFTISATDDKGFVQSITPTSFTLSTNQSANVTVTLQAPSTATPATSDTLTFTATGTSGTQATNFAVLVNDVGYPSTAPVISSISPTARVAGTTVTINGSGFRNSQGASFVTFNTNPAGAASSWSATSITIPVPPTASTGNVVVMVGGIASNPKPFTVLVINNGQNCPSVTSVSPSSGTVGTSVTVSGTNFGSAPGFLFFNNIAATPKKWSNTSITAPVPAGATTGEVYVKLSGPPTQCEPSGVVFVVQ